MKLENNFYFFKTFLNTQARSHIILPGKEIRHPLPRDNKRIEFFLIGPVIYFSAECYYLLPAVARQQEILIGPFIRQAFTVQH